MRITALPSAALLVFTSISLAAHADTLVVTGQGNTYTYTLPSAPTPDASQPGLYFTTVPTTSSSTYTQLGFGSPAYFADLGLIDPAGFQIGFSGPQLYTGTEAAPVLLEGTFSLINEADGSSYTAVIAPTVTPEPSSVLLLGTGLAGIVTTYRRGRSA